ncbi:MAG: hypothetical protein ACYTAN_05845 [Planctomycetota bacterium]|jgi:hypothetical protein
MAGALWAGIATRAGKGAVTRPIEVAVLAQAVILLVGTWHGSHLLGVKDPRTRERETAVARVFRGRRV